MLSHQLHLGDCLAVLPAVPSGSVDMVFADLPYGRTDNKWDTVIPFAPLWAELLRVGRPRAAFVFTATQPFATALINSQPRLFRHDLIWQKKIPSGYLNAKKAPLRAHEHVLVFCQQGLVYNPQFTFGGTPYKHNYKSMSGDVNHGKVGPYQKISASDGRRYPISILNPEMHKHSARVHPTQKPVALLEWLIRTYTNPGDTVLDPTMGSGTTGVACAQNGRNFTGIELDPGYFATAQQRLAAVPLELPHAS